MKFKLMGIIICLAFVLCFSSAGWAQDTAQPAQETTGQAVVAQEEPVQTPVVRIDELYVCQDVVDRAPVGTSDVFAKETGKVYCFSRVVGADTGSQVMHNWYHDGNLKASVKLNVRSPNFRTWTSKNLMPEWTGEWMVEVLDQDGKALDSIVFTVQ